MRLVRFGEARTGILIDLPAGPLVLDVAASIDALPPEGALGNDILRDILKDGGAWFSLIQHWASVRAALGKLADMASRTPDHPDLVILRLDELDDMPPSGKGGDIVALGIAENDNTFSYCAQSSRDCEIASCIYSARGGYLG